MGIDGINKPGGGGPRIGSSTPQGADSSFKSKLEAEGVQDAGSVEASTQSVGNAAVDKSPLEQLDAGTLSVDEYLDLQVDQAVAHLEGKLPKSQLDFVRETLREQLSEDPVLVELVRRTTAHQSTAGAGSTRS